MPQHRTFLPATIAVLLILVSGSSLFAEETAKIVFAEKPDQVQINIGKQSFATYVYRDEKTLRPFFANVHAPGGIRVTRKHPVEKKSDGGDHGTMHPGIWLAFGDINGADFWRNRARVVHAGFAEKPHVVDGRGSFAVRNEYRDDDKLLCRELCRYTLIPNENGILLISDSTFRSDEGPFTFGDQEELGLGVRVRRGIRVKGGNGRILNADGLKNEKQVWGNATDWCDYSGDIDGHPVGITLMPAPKNFRRSWFHVRDYGLMLANPFGRNALTGGEKSAVTVKSGEDFRLRFGVFVHAGTERAVVDLEAVYRRYLGEVAE